MSLKFRYASYLLLIFTLIVGCAIAATLLFNKGHYVAMVMLCILLYGVTFLVGKNMRKVFFVLSLINFIKRRNGIVSMDGCKEFVQKMLPTGLSQDTKELFTDEIIVLLEKEKVVEVTGDNLILIEL